MVIASLENDFPSLKKRKSGIIKKKNFRMSAQISWVGAGPPSLARGARQERRQRRRHSGPAPPKEIRADLRKFMFMWIFLPLL